ncbi:hypothetical protein L596_030195 [Steinernema carpocapsae]|uniref:Uncharacterized protein n=1 Tax=Steinernema carpocapsae TaxID=34508 RepID=A0A4U5LS03_STECR|nr:hypothetical protein L596_030195 [Steinernema carpocapsae]
MRINSRDLARNRIRNTETRRSTLLRASSASAPRTTHAAPPCSGCFPDWEDWEGVATGRVRIRAQATPASSKRNPTEQELQEAGPAPLLERCLLRSSSSLSNGASELKLALRLRLIH